MITSYGRLETLIRRARLALFDEFTSGVASF